MRLYVPYRLPYLKTKINVYHKYANFIGGGGGGVIPIYTCPADAKKHSFGTYRCLWTRSAYVLCILVHTLNLHTKRTVNRPRYRPKSLLSVSVYELYKYIKIGFA